MTDPKPLHRLPVISPTAIKLFRRCPRAGAFRYVEKVQTPQSPWAAEGTRMHAVLEQYAKSKKPLDRTDPEVRVAAVAIDYWPEGVEWDPEVSIRIDRGSFTYIGSADQLGPGFVGDYKFTGNKKNLPDGRSQWVRALWPRSLRGIKDPTLIASAESELQDDPQWIIYGNAPKAVGGGVSGQWTYVIKPPKMEGEPKVLPVKLWDSTETLTTKLEALDLEALTINWIRANYQTANDVPHDADGGCGGVGIYCDYAHKCNLKGESMKFDELVASVTGGEKAAATTPAPEPEAKAEPAPAEKEETPKVNPPEGDAADVQATAEEVQEKHPSGRKKVSKKTRKKTVNEATDEVKDESAYSFEAQLQSASAYGESTSVAIVVDAGIVVPVGARVRVTVLK